MTVVLSVLAGLASSLGPLLGAWWKFPLLVSGIGCVAIAVFAISVTVLKTRGSLGTTCSRVYLGLVLVVPLTYFAGMVPYFASPPVWVVPGLAAMAFVGAGLHAAATRTED